MKFLCEQADLLSALTMATRALAARSTMPAFESVRVEAADGAVRLMCTDLAMGIEATLSAQVSQEGCLLLPGRLFQEIVRKLPQGEVTVSSREYNVTIQAHGSRTNVQGLPANEFPSLPQIDDAASVVVDQRLLRDMIRQTAFAAAVEETKPALTGVLVEAEGQSITMVALDRFRMALRRGELKLEAPKVSAIVPARCMNEVARMLGDEEGEVALGFGRTHVALEIGAARISIRLLDDEYVKYGQLIPTEHKTVAKVDRAMLAECVDRAALIARDTKNNLINLQIEEDKLVITSQSENSNSYEELPVALQGNGLEIAFNVRYVVDAVRNLTDESIALRFTSPVSPCVLTPVEGDAYLYLLLPVRVLGK